MKICVKLMGGLGNQMFQYAIAAAVAARNQAKVYVDRSFLEKQSDGSYTQRHYALSELRCQPNAAGCLLRKELQLAQKYPSLPKLLPFIPVPFSEESPQFQKRVSEIRRSVLFIGYWQSEKYFQDYRPNLLREFAPRHRLSNEAQVIRHLIEQSPESVSIHVRRGDYVKLASAAAYHGVASLEYYQKAIDLIHARTIKPSFFLFSDDPDWVAANLKVSNSHLVKYLTEIEDLTLMKICKHNIIANSSFSWWAAWLNNNPGKIVIAPKKWFSHDKNPDLIPSSWIQI